MEEDLVCGLMIQYDPSGQGHAWTNVRRADIPANILEEIEGEIVNAEKESGQLTASNGLNYRW